METEEFSVDLNDLECFVKEKDAKASGVKLVLFYMATESLMFAKTLVFTTAKCLTALERKNMELVSNNQIELMTGEKRRYFRKYQVVN